MTMLSTMRHGAKLGHSLGRLFPKVKKQQSDSLVVGCGIAGSATALALASAGQKVTVLSATKALDCNSYWAQGGIVYQDKEGTVEGLATDIHGAGQICDKHAVNHVVDNAQKAVEQFLLGNNIDFDRDPVTKEFQLCLEGGHDRNRILHVGDQTGKAIMIGLNQAVQSHPNITLLENKMVFDLMQDRPSDSSRMCTGAWAYDEISKQVYALEAPNVVLATGGIGNIYQYTSNPESARGDGIALARRANVQVRGLEYVQFHPTTLDVPAAGSFLISEAVRGAGAVLRNKDGERFAFNHDPRGELATRDLVARMIWGERDRTGAQVFLDITHKRDEVDLPTRFPGIFEACMKQGYDLRTDLIPVVPAEHFACGGIVVDSDNGRTTLPGLYACGEVSSTGLHGANRLASTSLLEGLVYGRTIAGDIVERAEKGETRSLGRTQTVTGGSQRGRRSEKNAPMVQCTDTSSFQPGDAQGTFVNELLLSAGVLSTMLKKSQQTMWEKCGIIRSPRKLVEAREEIAHLKQWTENILESGAADSTSQHFGELLKLRNVLDCSSNVVECAAANRVSRGGHFVDLTEEDEMSMPMPAHDVGIADQPIPVPLTAAEKLAAEKLRKNPLSGHVGVPLGVAQMGGSVTAAVRPHSMRHTHTERKSADASDAEDN
jgi:L-aspartate oxidase